MKATMPYAHLVNPESLRTAPRRQVSIPASLTSSAAGQLSCRVDNLSRMGCRILIQCRFVRDAYLSITFPHKGPIGTSVAWSDGLRSGLEFCQPLHVAVLDDLLRLFDPPRSGADQDFVSLADWQG